MFEIGFESEDFNGINKPRKILKFFASVKFCSHSSAFFERIFLCFPNLAENSFVISVKFNS